MCSSNARQLVIKVFCFVCGGKSFEVNTKLNMN
jgi:hypothetical protein